MPRPHSRATVEQGGVGLPVDNINEHCSNLKTGNSARLAVGRLFYFEIYLQNLEQDSSSNSSSSSLNRLVARLFNGIETSIISCFAEEGKLDYTKISVREYMRCFLDRQPVSSVHSRMPFKQAVE